MAHLTILTPEQLAERDQECRCSRLRQRGAQIVKVGYRLSLGCHGVPSLSLYISDTASPVAVRMIPSLAA